MMPAISPPLGRSSAITVPSSGQNTDVGVVPNPLEVLVDTGVNCEPAVFLTRFTAIADQAALERSEMGQKMIRKLSECDQCDHVTRI